VAVDAEGKKRLDSLANQEGEENGPVKVDVPKVACRKQHQSPAL
jgi:hypothetical protein